MSPVACDRRVLALTLTLLAPPALLATASCARTHADDTSSPPAGVATGPSRAPADSVTLSDSQLHSISTARVAERDFPIERQALGNVDFNQNLTAAVSPPYAGRIVATFADLGAQVSKGQALFSLESPDFIAAQSSLIAALATYEQTTSALERARSLYASQGIDQNDYETAVANQHSAEGAVRAARRALAVFGQSEADIARIESHRTVERALVVRSPLAGRVTTRNAAPGLYVQPGNQPAVFAVTDTSSVWLIAQVTEADAPGFKVGQPLRVSVSAYPHREFSGRIVALGSALDPNTRRLMVRSEIKDPKHELIADMFASFVIAIGEPRHGPAVPVSGVVREGDGTFSVWVVDGDPHRFTRRTVKVGLTHDGYDEITEGIRAGETVATEGALFLSNILFGGAS